MEHRHRLHLLAGARRPEDRAPRWAIVRRALLAAIGLLLFALAFTARAKVFMTQQQALASAFPAGATVTRQAIYLKPEQVDAARKASGLDFKDQMVVRYTGTVNGRVAGYAYFDTHMVRTLPETVMVVVTPEGKLDRIEILSFNEPTDYLPKERWMDQFEGKKLDDDLSLKRSIRPISGASLSGRAIVNASRKILALHRVIK